VVVYISCEAAPELAPPEELEIWSRPLPLFMISLDVYEEEVVGISPSTSRCQTLNVNSSSPSLKTWGKCHS
jgi:hypothetical protein